MKHALLIVVLAAGGCRGLANRPADEDPQHLAIAWRPDFEAARADAARTGRPILMIGASGDITGVC